MYGNFVGTYKPAMQTSNDELNSNIKLVISILNDKTKTTQEKYNTLYDAFPKDQNISKLPLLVSLYCDDDFITKELDGSDCKESNEKLHGSAIRKYVNLITEEAKKESIVYKYVPGPFMRLYVNAIKNRNTPHLLIIEEINRANVPAVFGDVFQLLDRNSVGESQYHIQTSEDMRNYLQKELGGSIDDYSTIKIPNNMYIWATMNNADQNVMPMDTAFKRRWDFHYLGINDAAYQNKDDFKKYKFKINSSEVVLWDDFRKELNSQLSQLNISEDKLIGPYFISKSVLDENDIDKTTSTIKDKVLMYLYDDVAKAYRSSLFAENKYSTYSELCKHFDQNALSIFKNKLNVTSEPINNQSAKDVLNTSDNTNNS
ncbi:AAA family ATPase [Ureaplasma diversum]|uniref:Type II restriction modification system endonuclease n=1 Tax=Ureaplasma diversum NCTC 246 TaxID=1188241 RepID=A0A084EZ46_9BACT|nr:AAA family ATPase [Ureaplasma diversum]KEZ23238.1 Type II restriction modification system endonuclease [Ureaplasma diversum NCTC 246]